MNRGKLIPLLCAVIALGSWYFLPGTFLDRALFTATSHLTQHSPFLVTGQGTSSNPFTVRKLRKSPDASTVTRSPTVISIGDDPDRVFQSSPPSPVDTAIILRNLRRLGENSPAIATPLAWPTPDTISLTALDQQLDSFPSIVTSAPLSRGPTPTTLPPAFRRASIPLENVRGNTALLPAVNRLAISDAILGRKTSLAGFTTLESEPPSDLPQLLCRWDDRLILSFHLVTALEHFKVPPSAITVRLGEFLSFGKNGPFIPIDEYGRLRFSPPAAESGNIIQAPELVDAPDDFFPDTTPQPVIVRNDLTVADTATRAFSSSLVPVIATLTNTAEGTGSITYRRLPWPIEIACLFIILLLIFPPGFRKFPNTRDYHIPAVMGVIVLLHVLFFIIGKTTVPTLPALCATAAAALFLLLHRRNTTPAVITPTPAPGPAPAEPAPAEARTPFPAPEPSPKPLPKGKTAVVVENVRPKPAAKKADPEKTTAKKTSAKPSARKSTRKQTRQSRISKKAAKKAPSKKKSTKRPKS